MTAHGMERDPHLLGGLTPREFLRRHWQRRPLLVRGALAGRLPSLTSGELAGLACEDDVESRLVIEGDTDPRWQVRHGPFDRSDFAELPAERWTLLVQEVDRHLPAAAELLDRFRFIPNWRIDDVMVSHAAPRGGVGPHVDEYDVFLIQGAGRRRWRVGRRPVLREEWIPDLELRVLARFEPDDEWVLEPGDLLYLPPRVAHEGVALEPCLTYSVGFRAPSAGELLAGLGDGLREGHGRDPRYADPDLRVATDPGEITPAVIERVRGLLVEALDADPGLADRFARFVTAPRRESREAPPDPPYDPSELVGELRAGAVLHRSAASRFAWLRAGGEPEAAMLYVGGEAYPLGPELAFAAPLLCGTLRLDARALGPHLDDDGFVRLLVGICNRGFLVPEPSK